MAKIARYEQVNETAKIAAYEHVNEMAKLVGCEHVNETAILSGSSLFAKVPVYQEWDRLSQ